MFPGAPPCWRSLGDFVLTDKIMACHASAQSFGGLAAARTTMGIFEAGFFPAASYLLGEWYCRFELQWRLSIFFSAASLAGAFSGLLASGLQQMDGLRGISGWRWIFIVEGAVTVLVGLLVLVALPSYPATCTFLTDEEKIMIRSRLEQDSGTSAGRVETEDKYQWKTIKAALMDWRIWFTVFIYWGHMYVAPASTAAKADR